LNKYQKYRIDLLTQRLCEKLNVSEEWLERFINQKNYCWGRGRTLGDVIAEDELDVIERFLEN